MFMNPQLGSEVFSSWTTLPLARQLVGYRWRRT